MKSFNRREAGDRLNTTDIRTDAALRDDPTQNDDGIHIGDVYANNISALKSYVLEVLVQHYEQAVPGDVNSDTVVNVQDIILLVDYIFSNVLILHFKCYRFK